MKRRLVLALIVCAGLLSSRVASTAELEWSGAIQNLPVQRGIICVLGASDEAAEALVNAVEQPDLQLYFQSSNEDSVRAVRAAAAAAGVLGKKVFADVGPLSSIQLADNLADAILVAASAAAEVNEAELLRVLRPQAKATIGDRQLTKPIPAGIDDWSHVYHGPDNNPQSRDELVRGEFETQFIAEPTFSPMPEQTVVAGGRIFKAMGHIAHKANQNAMLNTLLVHQRLQRHDSLASRASRGFHVAPQHDDRDRKRAVHGGP